jgi:Carboxypeptidase regulatory-like domain
MSTRARLAWSTCLLLAWGSDLAAQSSAQPGQEQTAPEVSPQAFTVSGRVVDADGRPAHDVTVSIGTERDGGFVGESCDVAPDGLFRSRGLAPGLYVLYASAPAPDSAPSGGGHAVVTIRDADVADVTVTLHRSTQVAGRVTFESERGVETPYPTVAVHAVLAVERMKLNHGTTAAVAEDGTFTLTDIHGPRLIRVGYSYENNSSRWWPKAVLLDGVNVTNVPIDFSSKPAARLEVVFSDRPTAVVGVVHDEAGLPVEGARVRVFSTDASMWAAWSTAVQAGVSDENGRFWFVDAIPAGDYRAIALRENAPQSIAEAVDELPRLDKFAMPIVVSESKVARIELIISRAR